MTHGPILIADEHMEHNIDMYSQTEITSCCYEFSNLLRLVYYNLVTLSLTLYLKI
jgi:hypothetical protein